LPASIIRFVLGFLIRAFMRVEKQMLSLTTHSSWRR
jgi:hypothetical protein